MREELLAFCHAFKAILKDDPRFRELKEKEAAALSSDEVRLLHETLERKAKGYEEALSYGDETEKAKWQKELYEAKVALDSHPLMKEFNAAFAAWRDVEREIDDILFGPFRKKVLDIGE